MFTLKDLCSAILSREEQHTIEGMKQHFFQDDLPTLENWLSKSVRQIDATFVCTLAHVIDDLHHQTSLASTQQLFYLESMIIELLFHAFNHKIDEFEQSVLTQVLKDVGEDNIGPRISGPKDAADVYKRVYNYRGCRLAERGDYAASIGHFNVTLSLDPHFAPAYCNRARAYLELNHLEEARADCETMYAFDDKYPVGRTTYQLVNALRKHKALGEEGTAAELAEEYGLLELLRSYDRPLTPREMYEPRPENPFELPQLNMAEATAEELNHLGVVQVRSADFMEAIEAFNLAIERKPGYDRPYFNRAQAYMRSGNYAKAIADFSFLVQQDPQDANTKYFLAQAYEKWKQARGSEEISMDVALLHEVEQQVSQESVNEGNNDARLKEIGDLSLRLHQHQHALELLDTVRREAIKAYASLPANRRLQQAAIMERQGLPAEAVYYYSEALAMLVGTRDKSTLAICLEGLGRSQRIQGQMKDARDHLMQALDLSIERKDDVAEEHLYHQLGQLEEENDHLYEAQSWYRKAENLAHKSENWGGVFAALTHLSTLAMKLQPFEEQQRLGAECNQLQDEYGEIVYAGPTALPRPHVVIQARDLLYPQGLDIPDPAPKTSPNEILEQATSLRKDKKYQESLPLYLSALTGYMELDQPDGIAGCLNGLGICYLKMTEEVLLQARKELALEALEQEGKTWTLEHLEQAKQAVAQAKTKTNLVELVIRLLVKHDSYQLYQLIYTRAGELAEKGRTCHRWALELSKEMEDVVMQAKQISNLALIEEEMGNLDTAHRYLLWSIQVYSRAGELEDVAFDLFNLARIEEDLGDEEPAEAKRNRAKELHNAR